MLFFKTASYFVCKFQKMLFNDFYISKISPISLVDSSVSNFINAIKNKSIISNGGYTMKYDEYARRWSYYLSIEADFIQTAKYVAHSNDNMKTYSNEFTKIILLSCSEFDDLYKKLLAEKGYFPKSGKYFSAKDFDRIFEIDPSTKFSSFAAFGNDLCFEPFKELDASQKHANLFWWKNYQLLKHNRSENYKKATLETAAHSLAAHHKLLRILISTLDVPSKDFNSPIDSLRRSKYWYSNHFI